jgi:hypothetical protein
MTKLSPNLRAITEFLVVAICTNMFALSAMTVIVSHLEPNSTGSRNSVEYWASGHALAHHGNPCEAGTILKLERLAGFASKNSSLVMGNLPPAIPLVLILGSVNPFLWTAPGRLAWYLFPTRTSHASHTRDLTDEIAESASEFLKVGDSASLPTSQRREQREA